MDLQILLAAQAAYERALTEAGIPTEGLILRRSERDLDLTHQAFVATSSGRVMQIQVEEDVLPSAFLKKVGMDYDQTLLQVVVAPSDLKVDACWRLFSAWIDRRVDLTEVSALANAFAQAEA